MRHLIKKSVPIPEGIACEIDKSGIVCKKGSLVMQRKIYEPDLEIKIEKGEIIVECKKANKVQFKVIQALVAHLQNLLNGSEKQYEYKLEMCNVHFPMTAKVDGDKVVISNFLGEKKQRTSKIVKGAKVEIKGAEITVSSHNKEDAGQTAANLEKATKISKRDRRIFQDGIFIKQKMGRQI